MDILEPLATQPIGPGYIWRAQTDFIGPIEIGSYFELFVYPQTGETEIARAVEAASFAQVDGVVGMQRTLSSELYQLVPGKTTVKPGSPVRTAVNLRDPRNLIIDTDTVDTIWEPSLAPWVLQQQLKPSTPVQGGFTESDRVMLTENHAAVHSTIPFTTTAGGLASLALDQLLLGPPGSLLSESTDLFLTGRGSVNRPSGTTGVYAYGARWAIFSAPPGLGKLDGQVVEFEQRIAQIVVVKVDIAGREYIHELVDSHHASGQISWPIPFPRRVNYDVLPGVTLRFRWLLFLQ